MGVIQRQSFKSSIVNYLAAVVGAANIWFIYPFALNQEELGLIRVLLDTTYLLVPFLLMGTYTISIRFFPVFKNNENGHNGLLPLMSVFTLVGSLLFLLLFFLFKESYVSIRADDSVLLEQYINFLVPMTYGAALTSMLSVYILNFKRIVVPNIINNFTKFSIPLLALAYVFGWLNFNHLIWGTVATFGVMLICTLFYTYYLGELSFKPNWKFVKKPLLKEMVTFGMYGLLGGLGTLFVTRVDTIMLGQLAGLEAAGIYSFPMFIATAIAIPSVALTNIANPIIAEAWKQKDMKEINAVYAKSSINLLAVGILLFIGAWASIEEMYQIMPNGALYSKGMYVLFWLGLGKIFDMATGINNQIISYSPYFRFNFYAVLVLAVCVVGGNYLLIPAYGVNGAALASASALAIYNIAKFLFIWWRFKMQPFSWNTLWVILLGLLSYFLAKIVPSTSNAFLDILIKSSLISLVYGGLIYYFKLSLDINSMIDNMLKRIFKN